MCLCQHRGGMKPLRKGEGPRKGPQSTALMTSTWGLLGEVAGPLPSGPKVGGRARAQTWSPGNPAPAGGPWENHGAVPGLSFHLQARLSRAPTSWGGAVFMGWSERSEKTLPRSLARIHAPRTTACYLSANTRSSPRGTRPLTPCPPAGASLEWQTGRCLGGHFCNEADAPGPRGAAIWWSDPSGVCPLALHVHSLPAAWVQPQVGCGRAPGYSVTLQSSGFPQWTPFQTGNHRPPVT